MIKIQNNTATREPLPAFLVGLKPESLLDLSWTDPALGVQDAAWWPEESGDGPLPPGYKWGAETLALDQARKVVVVTHATIALTSDDLAGLKEAKDAEINAARLAANFTAFPHAGKLFACDQLSRSDIDGTNGYVSLNGTLPVGWPSGWKAVDGSYVAIATVEDWKGFYASMFAQGNANFAKAQQLKAALAAATTFEQIAAIQWDD